MIDNTFLPNTLNQWLAAIGIIGGWIIWSWRVGLTIKTDLNNVGTRINSTEIESTRHETEIANLKLELQRSIDDRNIIREKVAGNTKSLDELRDEIRDDRLAVIATLHINEKTASERDAVLRETLARLQERINIEEIVRSVVRHSANLK